MKRQKAIHIWNDLWRAWPVLGDLIPESGMAFEMKLFGVPYERKSSKI